MNIVPERLKNIFSLRSKKTAGWKDVPSEITENPVIRKAITKSMSKEWRHKWRNRLLAATALSTVLQFMPWATSTDYNSYMQDQGHGQDLKDHFHAANIRVYHRYNPAYPFHLAGEVTKLNWQDGLKEQDHNIVGMTLATPFVYAGTFLKGTMDLWPGGTSLDAYSLTGGAPAADRTCYIRPPGAFTLQEFLGDFTGIKLETVKTKNDAKDLERIFNAYVMLHEARHCDQNKDLHASPVNESDADLYAFKTMQSRGTDPKLLQESHTLIKHIRVIRAVAGGDIGHASSLTLGRGEQTLNDAHRDASIFQSLHNLLADAQNINRHKFDKEVKYGVQIYHLAHAMLEQGMLKNNPDMEKAAESYMTAVWHMDKIAGNKVLNQKVDGAKLDLSLFGKEYKPVPDKLAAPKKAAAPGA